MIIGIDIGSTTTKAVSIENGKLIKKVKTKTIYQKYEDARFLKEAFNSANEAFEKIVQENGIKPDNIEKIKITGAGSSKINNDIFGIPASHVNEIDAIGIGGMFLSGMKNIIITNIGTGTVIVEAGDRGIFHFGGSGVGGGTILGLAKKLLPAAEFNDIIELAKTGKINQVDLLLGDITDTSISFLNTQSTASNFGKMLDNAKPQDIALGILNMVYQVIGVLSVFAAKAKNIEHIVVTGNGSKNQTGRSILADVSSLYGAEFIYPEYAEYSTAIGAALHVS